MSPKQERWYIKRDMDRALDHLDRAQRYLIMHGIKYEKDHPDLFGHFSAITSSLELTKDAVSSLRDEI